jgi:hypothetical protein
MVTYNHVHLLVADDGDRGAIAHSMQLAAGRTAQEFNQRKDRRGAYWEDRYHATAVESGEHLARCMVYIDTNMVRAGVVGHPSEWPFCGYNEIQEPRRKNVLIDYRRLQDFMDARSYDDLKSSHKGWVEEYIRSGAKTRQEEWTGSIAVGSKFFVENIRSQLRFQVKGRDVIGDGDGYQLREEAASYSVLFGAKNSEIGAENAFLWNLNLKYSNG